MPQKNFRFYSELVLVTVLGFVAGHAWERWLGQVVDEFFPGNVKADFFVAFISTVVAILTLHLLFSDDKNQEGFSERDEYTYDPAIWGARNCGVFGGMVDVSERWARL